MKTIEVLQKARELIANPSRWCKKSFARNHTGTSVGVNTNRACQWCASGAISRAVGTPHTFVSAEPARHALILAIGGDDMFSIASWNDSSIRTHSEVLAAFDSAIEICNQSDGGDYA